MKSGATAGPLAGAASVADAEGLEPPTTDPDGKVPLSFEEIRTRLRSGVLEAVADVDLVVGVATGGTAAALMVAHELAVPVEIIRLNLRDEQNDRRYEVPKLIGDIPDVSGKRILLVDDVSVSGTTLAAARELLPAAKVATLVVKGRDDSADVVLFAEVRSCVVWPW